MTEQQRKALRLLSAYTANRFDIWMLAGPTKASVRAHIMSALNGRRTPQSKSGIYAIQSAFHSIAQPQGSCIAIREENFIAWAKAETTHSEFIPQTEKLICPQCLSENVTWYDGCLGYEAIRCLDCRTETDANSGATCALEVQS